MKLAVEDVSKDTVYLSLEKADHGSVRLVARSGTNVAILATVVETDGTLVLPVNGEALKRLGFPVKANGQIVTF